ncbi:MAG TPA: hypothetical protein VF171_01305 [Trueperaceae bacterium]
MSSRYDHAFDFFRLLSEVEAELPGGRALANPKVPLLLSNAVWHPNAAQLEPVAGWYAERGIEPAVVVPAERGEELEDALQGGPYVRAQAFAFRALEPSQDSGFETSVEQVNWAQGRALGEVLAAHYGMPRSGTALGGALTVAMQRSPKVLGFVAYDDGVAGAMVLYETAEALTAMLSGGRQEALQWRLAAEAEERGVTPFVLEVLAEDAGTRQDSFERWSIL